MKVMLRWSGIPGDRPYRIRVKSSGRVISVIPVIAAAMVDAGTGDLVDDDGEIVPNAVGLTGCKVLRSKGARDA